MIRKETSEFKAKHPQGLQPRPELAAAVRAKVKDGELSCAHAELIARKEETTLAEVGTTLDLLEIRIGACQLGLFGYQPVSKTLAPAPSVAPELEAAIRGALKNGRLPCKAAWDIAATLKLSRKSVAAASETLQIKIKHCQLGAF